MLVIIAYPLTTDGLRCIKDCELAMRLNYCGSDGGDE